MSDSVREDRTRGRLNKEPPAIFNQIKHFIMKAKQFTKEQAIALVEENAGTSYDYSLYEIGRDYSFEELADLLERTPKDYDDYPMIVDDMEDRIESCGFDLETHNAIFKAVFQKEDLVRW